jgi:hypothetical protein
MAKGSGIYFEKRYQAVGTTTIAFATVEFDSRRAASRAFTFQNFYAYMQLEENDRTLVRLGRVQLGRRYHTGAELDARVRFRIPSGTEGEHIVMICPMGCTHLPKAPHPTSITIVSGPLEERMNLAIDRLAARQGSEKLAPHVRCDCGEIDRRNFYTEQWSESLRQRIIYDARIKDSDWTRSIQSKLQTVRGRLAAGHRKDGSIVPWLMVGVVVAIGGMGLLRGQRSLNSAR